MAARKSAASKTELAAQADPRAALAFEAFLAATQRVLKALGEDLLQRADNSPSVTEALKARWQAEKDAQRTADVYEVYRRRVVGQVAAAWVLSVVFVRTLEDRGLVDRNRIAGPGALDSQRQFFELAPYLTERDYLLTVFRELSNLEAAKDLFDAKHDLLWRLAPSAQAAKALLDLFRAPNAETPTYRFGQSDTRFLGDLYQLLDEDVRERYALLQTPRFVESFILDRTLERNVKEFGVDGTTMIDPTCGSGHFLLGAFERLLEHRLRARPGEDVRTAVQETLKVVHGVDVNPYAVSIARFRLTLAALEKGEWTKISGAPALALNLVVADSLLHGTKAEQTSFGDVQGQSTQLWKGEQFALEDELGAQRVLGKYYAVVVGNPPYITVKDAALREQYRKAYSRSAAGKYSLGAPFTQRFFELARQGGWVGMITANSFMKREFGKRLIEDYLQSVNLELIANTSGAYIPGHGTPTVMLFGRKEASKGGRVRAVLAKRGEPSTPENPEQGLVWRSVVEHCDDVGFDNDYVSVADIERGTIDKHPWSLGGGGAAELKELLEERAEKKLGDIAVVGVGGMSNADDVYISDLGAWRRYGMPERHVRVLVIGEELRDWSHSPSVEVYFPYTDDLALDEPQGRELQLLWPYRTTLAARAVFGGGTYRSAGRPWWEWHQLTKERYRTPLSIAYAEVATHNHFVLDRGGKVFKQTAPIIKLPETATEDDHLALLGYLNSSTACFWMKQVCVSKGTNHSSEANSTPFLAVRAFNATRLAVLPVPFLTDEHRSLLINLARQAIELASEREALTLRSLGDDNVLAVDELISRRGWLLRRLVSVQEDIDWCIYSALGFAPAATLGCEDSRRLLSPGERPFERQLWKRGGDDPDISWFRWHELSAPSSPLQQIDSDRLRAIEESPELALLENVEYKRRWLQVRGKSGQGLNCDANSLAEEAKGLLCDTIEACVADCTVVANERELEQRTSAHMLRSLSEWLSQRTATPVDSWVRSMLAEDSVPFIAALRHTEAGLEKRAAWERVWTLQRAEQRGVQVADFDAPPKYELSDFVAARYYRLRGKLDVPKERFISYPGCESDEDGSPVYGWAGWNHLQQAQALAALYQKRKTEEGWGKDRLIPMLAGLDELVPWVIQWHNEPDESFGGTRLGDFFRDFLAGECQALGLTLDDVRAWRPESKKARGAKKAAASKKATTKGKKVEVEES